MAIKYTDLFAPDVHFGLLELEEDAKRLDQTFANLAKVIGSGKARINISIKQQSEELNQLKGSLTGVDVAGKNAGDTIVKISKAVEENIKKTEQLKNSQKLYNDTLEFAKGSVDEHKAKIKQLTAEYNSLGQATDKDKQRAKALADEVVKLKKQHDELNNALKVTKNVVNLAEGSYAQASKRLGDLRNSLRELPNAINKTTGEWNKANPAVQAHLREIEKLDHSLKKMDATMGNYQRNVGNYASAFDKFKGILGNVGLGGSSGGAMGIAANAASGAALGPWGAVAGAAVGVIQTLGSAKESIIDFDAQLLNISKTTNLSGKDLTDLGDDIVKLSRDLKTVGTPALMEYATVAGQLGVRGSKNILAFSETLAKLQVASNIKGEQGATEVARLLQLVEGGVQNVRKFGDEIVNLGNNFAATESEILGNAESIAQNTVIYKLGRQEVLAYGVATKQAGIEQEVAGSKIGKSLKFLENAILTGENLDTVMKLTGMSAKELGEQFKKNSGQVLFKFIEGLNGIHKSGGSVTVMLNELGLKEERVSRVIGTLATGGFPKLKEAIDMVRDSVGSMDEEFGTASTKISVQTGRIKTAWENLVLSVENGQGYFGRAMVSLSDYFATALEGLTQLVSSKSWGELATRLNPLNWGGKAQKIIDLKSVYEETKKYTSDLSKLGDGSLLWFSNEAKEKNNKEFESMYLKAKDTYDKMKKASIEYEAAVIAGTLKEGDVKVAHYKKQEGLAKSYYLRLEQIRKERGINVETGVTSGKGGIEKQSSELNSIKAIRDEIKKLSAMDGSAEVGSDIYNRIVELKKRLKELSPSAKQAKEGFAQLEDQLKSLGLEIEKGLLDGKIDESDKKLADLYKKLGKRIEDFKKLRSELLNPIPKNFNANRGVLGSPNDNITIQEPAGNKNAGVDRETDNLQEIERRYANHYANLLKLYREGQLTKRQYEVQANDLEISRIHEVYFTEQNLINERLQVVKKGSREELQLKRQQAELEKKYQQDINNNFFQGQEARKKAVREMLDVFKETASVVREYLGNGVANFFDAVVSDLEKFNTAADWSAATFGEKFQAAAEIAKAAMQSFTDYSNEASERRIESYRKEKENDLAIAGDNEEAKKAIEDRYNENVKREKEKQARANKLNAMFEIGINTAIAASKVIGQTGLFGIPLVPIVVGLGLAQLALVAAKPIPQFFKGTTYSPEGPAEVAERGPELVEYPTGQKKLFKDRQVTYLPKGSKVYTALQTQKLLERMEIERQLDINSTIAGNISSGKRQHDIETLALAMNMSKADSGEIAEAVALAISKLPITNWSVDERGFSKSVVTKNSRITYLNNKNSL